MYSSIPAARQISLSPCMAFAVTAIRYGRFSIDHLSQIARDACSPSITGIYRERRHFIRRQTFQCFYFTSKLRDFVSAALKTYTRHICIKNRIEPFRLKFHSKPIPKKPNARIRRSHANNCFLALIKDNDIPASPLERHGTNAALRL